MLWKRRTLHVCVNDDLKMLLGLFLFIGDNQIKKVLPFPQDQWNNSTKYSTRWRHRKVGHYLLHFVLHWSHKKIKQITFSVGQTSSTKTQEGFPTPFSNDATSQEQPCNIFVYQGYPQYEYFWSWLWLPRCCFAEKSCWCNVEIKSYTFGKAVTKDLCDK